MIAVSSQDLLANANHIRQLEQEMTQQFQAISCKVRNLAGSWNSPASAAFLQRFETLQPVFSSYTETVNTYIQYLEQTAQSYQETEQQLVQCLS